MSAEIPGRHMTRYRLAKAQLDILPYAQMDSDDEFDGVRLQCEETIAFCEELGTAEAALSQAQKQVVRLKEVLQSLTAKIHELDGNESLKSVLTIAFVHGCKYTGPTWKAELATADAALADIPDQKEKS